MGVTQYLTGDALDATFRFTLSLPRSSEIVFSFVLPPDAVTGIESDAMILAAERAYQLAAVSPGRIQSLAVLPFKALAGGSDPALELGMADALITKLSNIRQIVVRPTGSVLKYIAAHDDPVAAGRELKVDAVLEGSVQRADDRIRVTARLFSVQDGRPLWGEQFDEPWTSILGVQDSISERIVRARTLELTGTERARLTRHYTQNLEAYQAYSLGRCHWNRRNAEGIQKARDYFGQAIRLHPGYMLACSGLADSCELVPPLIGGAPKEPFERARGGPEGVQIDDTAAEPHASLGNILVHYDFDWSGAEREFKRALDLNPNYGTRLVWGGLSIARWTTRRSHRGGETRARARPGVPVHQYRLGARVLLRARVRSRHRLIPQDPRHRPKLFGRAHLSGDGACAKGQV
jgi:TolB-like protein